MAANLRCCTDLLDAVERGCLKCVRIFSDDPEQHSLTNTYGENALHLAVLDFSILAYLLPRMEFLINKRDIFENTPLYHFLGCRGNSLKTIELLILSGADVNILDRKGQNSLSVASTMDLETFKFLQEKGANSIEEDSGYNVLLKCAQLCNDIKLFKYILENRVSLGIDPINDEYKYGRNILHFICMSCNGFMEKISSLLRDEYFVSFSLNKNINKKDDLGNTPLMYFLSGKFRETDSVIESLKMLLSLGADPLIENKGKTCIEQTQIESFKKIMIEYQDLPS